MQCGGKNLSKRVDCKILDVVKLKYTSLPPPLGNVRTTTLNVLRARPRSLRALLAAVAGRVRHWRAGARGALRDSAFTII
ncbi:hypothetical protein RR46_08776 [Papilio xuthus]|uniref:Uncharacterized protein n=1 Tax=Papilio xuthus TaxID=66420 RepID=A0A194PPS7_PAPXU|nr:hypothetical protein RR46_08776 [Papilio xuthus]